MEYVFNPADNPIGTKDLESLNISLTSNLLLTQLYADLILGQSAPDFGQIDAGLATEIKYAQQRMVSTATFFLNQISPSVITYFSGASNFSVLADQALGLERGNIVRSYDSDPSRREAVTMITSLIDQLQTIDVNLQSTIARFTSSERGLSQFADDYQKELDEAIDLTSKTAKAASDLIDNISKEIRQNIQDIVNGGATLGEGITKLGIGMLTTVTGALEDPAASDDDKDADKKGKDDKKKKKEDPKKPGVPDVSFVADAVNLASKGVALQSQAAHDLKSNNDELAKAYQKMAAENALVTIAKVIQTQNNLFRKSLSETNDLLHEVYVDWTGIESNFSSFKDQIASVSDQLAANQLGSEAHGAQLLWQSLKGQFSYIRSSLTDTAD